MQFSKLVRLKGKFVFTSIKIVGALGHCVNLGHDGSRYIKDRQVSLLYFETFPNCAAYYTEKFKLVIQTWEGNKISVLLSDDETVDVAFKI